MLKDSEKHYHFSNQLMEQVNRAAHDTKHTLRALPYLSEAEREDYINRTLENIERYQQYVYTSNEVLNTILYEKILYAKSKNVKVNVSAGDIDLNFIDIIDLYTLLGNVLDNAIEGAEKLEDESRRIANLTIQQINQFISIQCNNYYKNEIKKDGENIKTTKLDAGLHGFGIKSIKAISKKYNGGVVIDTTGNVFSLQIMLPKPVK